MDRGHNPPPPPRTHRRSVCRCWWCGGAPALSLGPRGPRAAPTPRLPQLKTVETQVATLRKEADGQRQANEQLRQQIDTLKAQRRSLQDDSMQLNATIVDLKRESEVPPAPDPPKSAICSADLLGFWILPNRSAALLCCWTLPICCAALLCRFVVPLCCAALLCRFVVPLCCAALLCRFVVPLCCAALLCRFVVPLCWVSAILQPLTRKGGGYSRCSGSPRISPPPPLEEVLEWPYTAGGGGVSPPPPRPSTPPPPRPK